MSGEQKKLYGTQKEFQSESNYKDKYFILLSLLLICLIFFAYSNHFSNAFHFDDDHTIVNNTSIKEFNIVDFFTDGKTFSSLVTNQSYRPFTTMENALDYKIAGGLNPKILNIHIFLTFIIVCFLIFFMVEKLVKRIEFTESNKYWALLAASIFGLLCVNAETVNYIIQRAEITSALFVLAGFVAFLSGGRWRKYYVYLLFPLIGFFAKEMTFVFAPLLFLYFLLFEEEVYLLHFYKKNEFEKCLISFKKVFPAFIMTVGFLIFYKQMLPETFNPGGVSAYKYLITQPFVICHYLVTYFIPYNLSADTDWQVFDSIFNHRALVGIAIVGYLCYLALKLSKDKGTRLISFGLLWFFISLLPTSSFIPFSEVLNDHRTFIPYIGLTISVVFTSKYLIDNYIIQKISSKNLKATGVILLVCFFSANIYGIRERNKVWKNDLTLWKDVTLKSPKNGRGIMNYGLALMGKGDYKKAEENFNKAKVLIPNYSPLYVNLGIVKNAMGDATAAEENFKKALQLGLNKHTTLYFYARFLFEQNRYTESRDLLKQAYEIAPNFENTFTLLMRVYHKLQNWEQLKVLCNQVLASSPQNENASKYLVIANEKKSELQLLEDELSSTPTASGYLNLSLNYFQNEMFKKTISASRKAIELKNNYPEAYNNMGIAYFGLANYDSAIVAYNKALELKKDFKLARNNLANAISERNTQIGLEKEINNLKTKTELLNFSLKCYNLKKFRACIRAANKANILSPSSIAYNNICAAHNELKEYDKAVLACKKALDLDSENALAQGNLNFALAQNKNKQP